MIKQTLIIALLPLLLFKAVYSQNNGIENRVYHTLKLIGQAPSIDGVVDEECWETVSWAGDFTQRSPFEGEKPSQETVFKILYDDNNLYVAIRAFDTEPEKIEKRLSRRDNFDGDWVAISIDSYNDNRTGYNFYVTAAGVKADVINTNDTQTDNTWNPVWYTKVCSDELGWIAEIKIPFTQLRFPKIENHEWGLEVYRRLFRKQELSVWQMIPQDVSGWVSRWGTLKGIRNINPKKEIELIPYIMGSFEKSEKVEGNPFITGTGWKYNAGIDGKIAVTNDLTLNFTINPDFGQVEADPSEVNLSAFESFFQEKRPFFVEGSSIFSFPLIGGSRRVNLFYSRRIGRRPHYYPDLNENEYVEMPEFSRILAAFKLSGKTKSGWSIGVMESVTNREIATIDSLGSRRKEVVEPLTNFLNIRLQKDINDGNTIVGGMLTATNRFINDEQLKFIPEAAYTGGLDFTTYWKDRNYYVAARADFSTVQGDSIAITDLQRAPQRYFQRPDMNHRTVDSSLRILSGTGGSFEIGKIGGGNWRYGTRAWFLSPGLDVNDMGFMQRSDAFSQTTWLRYTIWEPFSVFRNMNINFEQWSWWDFSGRYLNLGLRLGSNFQFVNYWFVNLGAMRDFKDVNRSELRGGPSLVFPDSWRYWMSVHSDSRRKLVYSVNGSYNIGSYNQKKLYNLGAGITYRPLGSLKVSVNPGYTNNFELARYVLTNNDFDKPKYIVASLMRNIVSFDLRLNYGITPDLSVQYWGQPFFYNAEYTKFAKVVDAGNMLVKDQYYQYSDAEISYNENDDQYIVNDTDGESFDFDNPDFSVFEFRSNFVIRWEYVPGSTAYFVWSQGRAGSSPEGNISFNEHITNLVDLNPTNILLLKFSYRLSM